ncbi:unnamed protein product [Cuscuta campestris]|uniref:COX assembly mitochondrial protein n=1 Tax=Cuscuta campestris TaxID=132261 RepID=A0A484N4Z2_9ASTE|nr:unnamed protein product [Cuscuta campestris]
MQGELFESSASFYGITTNCQTASQIPQSEMPYTSGDPCSPSASGEGNLNKCSQLYEALTNCHRRIRGGLDREIACRHLNRSLAQCLVAEVCPDESDAVHCLCSSGGTSIKRQQCREAQVALSVCLASHQSPP